MSASARLAGSQVKRAAAASAANSRCRESATSTTDAPAAAIQNESHDRRPDEQRHTAPVGADLHRRERHERGEADAHVTCEDGDRHRPAVRVGDTPHPQKEQAGAGGDGTVARRHVGHLVSDDGLQLLPCEPRQRAFSDADAGGAAWIGERDRVHGQGADDDGVELRQTGRDAHLVDDVREPVVIGVVRVGRRGTQRLEQPRPGAQPRGKPGDGRDHQTEHDRQRDDLAQEPQDAHRPETRVGPVRGREDRPALVNVQQHGEQHDERRQARPHDKDEQTEQRPDAPARVGLDFEERRRSLSSIACSRHAHAPAPSREWTHR